MNIASNPILEILLSITLIYALLSILVSTINELFSHYYEQRSLMLRDSIIKLLKDNNNHSYGELFFNNINIQAIMRFKPRKYLFGLISNKKASKQKVPPSYISSSMFADTLIDTIAAQAKHLQGIKPLTDPSGKIMLNSDGLKTFVQVGAPPPKALMEKFAKSIEVMNPSAFRDLLQNFNDRASGDYEKLKSFLEAWFNDYQDRVSGWYKSRQRYKLVWIGMLIAIFLNADSFYLIKVVSLDDKLRSELVLVSENVADKYGKLNDSLKNNTAALMTTFSKSDTTFKSILDSIKAEHELDLKKNPATLVDILIKSDTVRFKKIKEKLEKNKFLNDSLSVVLKQQANDILELASEMNIPIGYYSTSAPLSWFCKDDKSELVENTELLTKKEKRLMTYTMNRNKFSGFNLLTYLLGLIITGFALSVGAPFWFSLLVKLVDIRRAGIKPGTDNKK